MKKLSAILLTAGMLLSLAACGAQPVGSSPAGIKQTEEGTQRPSETVTEPGYIKKAQAADLLEGFTPQPVEDKEADEAFIRAGYTLAARLFGQVYKEEQENKTLLISPLSILAALAMTENGAEGNTLKEMEALLGSGALSREELNAYLHTYLKSLPSSEKAKFSFANAIWFKDQADFVVEDAFLQKNVNYFEAAIRKAPFDASTVQEINQWVDQHTDHMIDKILEGLREEDRMVLVNALVFDAKWAVPFDNPGPYLQPFTNLQGNKEEADYLFGKVEHYLENGECTGFMKSYAGDNYRFVALLPKNEKNFDGFVESLSGEKLAALLQKPSEETVNIQLPKFSFDYSASLAEVLSSLGMKDAFTDAASFSGISKKTPLRIGDVLHKTHIDLDSEGTRAAAVTSVIMETASAIIESPREVLLTRPFVYMIVDTETNLPIFMGTVTSFEK